MKSWNDLKIGFALDSEPFNTSPMCRCRLAIAIQFFIFFSCVFLLLRSLSEWCRFVWNKFMSCAKAHLQGRVNGMPCVNTCAHTPRNAEKSKNRLRYRHWGAHTRHNSFYVRFIAHQSKCHYVFYFPLTCRVSVYIDCVRFPLKWLSQCDTAKRKK